MSEDYKHIPEKVCLTNIDCALEDFLYEFAIDQFTIGLKEHIKLSLASNKEYNESSLIINDILDTYTGQVIIHQLMSKILWNIFANDHTRVGYKAKHIITRLQKRIEKQNPYFLIDDIIVDELVSIVNIDLFLGAIKETK